MCLKDNLGIWTLSLCLALVVSCSGGGSSETDSPVAPQVTPGTAGAQDVESGASGHYLWGYYMVSIDPESLEAEVVPVRQVTDHWNVLNWLEQGPCTTCLQITGITASDHGTTLVDVMIRHPFSNLNVTGFDVRGIAIFNGSREFPYAGLTSSDRTLGDGELVNAEGYTALYSADTAGWGPGGLQGYLEGRFATATIPDAELNGYIRYVSIAPANIRNAFYAGEEITRTFDIDMPDSEFVFGYAVDASWAPPVNKPVVDPMTDFGPEANCPEAWNIVITSTAVDEGLTDCGGEVKLTVEVYDWQGKDDVHPVLVECQELFYGQVEVTWKSDGVGFATYEAVVGNNKKAPPGIYQSLVSKEAQENVKPWLDLTAYRIIELEVSDTAKAPPTAAAEAGQTNVYADEIISFDASGSHDNDCSGQSITKYEWDWENDGVYDDNFREADHSWPGAGTYYVQLRVTDNEGDTDTLDEAIEITIQESGDPINPVDVTPPMLNFNTYCIAVYGNYAYISCGDYGLHIFNISDPANPIWVNRVDNYCIDMDIPDPGGYLYAFNGLGLQIIDIDPPESAQVVHTVDTPEPCMGGTVAGSYAYLVDTNAEPGVGNFHFIDISVPESASIIETLDIGPGSENVAVSGGCACVAAGYQGLKIIDIDPPESAYIVKTLYAGVPEVYYRVEASDGYAYAGVSDHTLNVIDIDPPEDAHVVKHLNGISPDMVSGNYLYAAGWSLQVVDIEVPEEAQVIKSIDIPGSGNDVDVSEGYAYVTAGVDGFHIVDVDPLESANIVKSFVTPGSVREVAVIGEYAYVTDYNFGLRVIDIDPPESAFVVKSVGMPGNSTSGFAVWGGYAYVGSDGFQIIDIKPLESAYIIGKVAYSYTPGGITISNGYAYSVHGSHGLQIVDISMPAWAWINKTVDTPGKAYGVAASGGYAYVADNDAGLQIIDVDPLATANIVNTVALPDPVDRVALSGGYAYVLGIDTGLQIVDIDPVESAYIVNSVVMPGSVNGIDVAGGYAYVVGSDSGLQVVDIDPPESAYIYSSVDTPGSGYCVSVAGNHAYVAGGSSGLRVIQLW